MSEHHIEAEWPRAFDVDTGTLAEALRDIADGLEDGSVRVREADGGLQATAEDMSRSVGNEIRLKYHAEDMTDAMLHPLQFEEDSA